MLSALSRAQMYYVDCAKTKQRVRYTVAAIGNVLMQWEIQLGSQFSGGSSEVLPIEIGI